MTNKLLALCIIFLMCVSSSFAQERKKIDRSRQDKRESTKTISKSVSKSTKSNNSPTKSSYLEISSQSISFGSEGGTKTITVSSNISWNISVNPASWGHLTRNGNTLTLNVDANTGTSSRTDYFTIKSGSIEKRVNISQNGQTVLTASKAATINSVTVFNDADVEGKKGLSVHVSFNISGMKDKDARVSCYFYDRNGNALVNTNGSYGTTGSPSYVSSGEDIKPGYDNSLYSDLEIKIPYDELHLSGTYSRSLRVDVLIWDYSTSSYTEITRKENTSFTCVPNISFLKVDGSTSDKTKYFSETGGREYYSVSTSANSYETWGVPSWCSIENKTSSGFYLVCNRNTSSSSRSDYMKVMAAGKEIRIDIKQEANSGPTATITSVEQEHNIFNGYVKGMNIKLKFNVNGMLHRTIKATAWFYYGDNTTKLNNGYGGQVNVYRSDTALYENTTFTMTLFMPYQSLNMARGFNGYLSFDIVISDSSGNTLTRQNNYRFTYSLP